MKKVNLIIILFCCFVFTSMTQTVTIGNQVWMTKNLDVSKFRNGDLIPEVKTSEEWEAYFEEEKPAWRYYDNDPKNGEKYGKLYNWYAVSDPRGLAPEGWRVPSNNEWTTLINYLSEDNGGIKMKSTSGWKDNGNGTNSTGFSGLPGGYYDSYDEKFGGIQGLGFWWSCTEMYKYSYDTWITHLFGDYDSVRVGKASKEGGYSVRCVKD
jgi:uncharacterized protein (TIGR02145 family)